MTEDPLTPILIVLLLFTIAFNIHGCARQDIEKKLSGVVMPRMTS